MTRDTEQEVKPCKFVGGACVNCDATERGDCQGFVYNTYTPREWQGLTDEDICVCDATSDLPVHDITWGNLQLFARAIESKLKEKNSD